MGRTLHGIRQCGLSQVGAEADEEGTVVVAAEAGTAVVAAEADTAETTIVMPAVSAAAANVAVSAAEMIAVSVHAVSADKIARQNLDINLKGI